MKAKFKNKREALAARHAGVPAFYWLNTKVFEASAKALFADMKTNEADAQ